MKTARALVVFGLALMLTACASGGVKIDQSKLAQFHEGSTTYQQVIDQLGEPTGRMVADGQTTITYTYVSSKTRAETFIPIAGAFIGGADSQSETTSFIFNRSNVLTHMSSSSNTMSTKMQ